MFGFSKKSTTAGAPNSCTPTAINSLDLQGIINTTALLATRLKAFSNVSASPVPAPSPVPSPAPARGLNSIIKAGNNAEQALAKLKLSANLREKLNNASEGDITAARTLLDAPPKYTIPDDIQRDTNVVDAKAPFIASMGNLERILPSASAASSIPIPTKEVLAAAVAKYKADQAIFLKAVATATLEEGRRKVTSGDTSARLSSTIAALEASITAYSAANAATRITDDMDTKTATLIEIINPGAGAGAGMRGGARRRRHRQTNKINRRRHRQTRNHH